MDLKMVNKVWSKGSRKDLYEVEYDWHQTFTDFFAIKWRKAVETNLLVLRKAIDELDRLMNQGEEYEEFKAILQQDRMKMKHTVAYYKWLDRLIDSMESEEIYKLIPKEEVRD